MSLSKQKNEWLRKRGCDDGMTGAEPEMIVFDHSHQSFSSETPASDRAPPINLIPSNFLTALHSMKEDALISSLILERSEYGLNSSAFNYSH